MNYYNEFDEAAAAWLRALIDAGEIPPGVVDTRSIEDVTPNDLAGFVQCHFFSGIGGWPLALKLAGWPEDRAIWTGSCPCQPFSAAGKGDGFADERHLWPSFHWLIQQCRPAVVVGEQVASAAVGPWIDLVLTDLEALGYAGGAYAGPAAGVGAPHLRDRAYWVGYADDARPQGHAGDGSPTRGEGSERPATETGVLMRLADAASIGRDGWRPSEASNESGTIQRLDGLCATGQGSPATSPTNGHWRNADWLFCRDGKWRPTQPGLQPLAHGIPARVGRLRGYGNAINPYQAAEVMAALMEIIQ